MVVSSFPSFFVVVRSSHLPHSRLAASPADDWPDPVQEHTGSLHRLLPSVQTQPGGPGTPASLAHHSA